MNDAGWTITSITLPESQWQNGIRTAYRLDSKPLHPGDDWYEHLTGKTREQAAAPAGADLPLFARVP